MSENALTKELGEYSPIRYLHAHNATFIRTPGGFLSLATEGEEKYPRVNLHRAFPYSGNKEFISVRDPEGKEIGMIRNMEDFSPETVTILEEQLDRRYFAPEIARINSIREEFGYSYWQVVTDAGECRFTVRGGQNITTLENHRVIIVDVDGNRFEIPDLQELDEKSKKKLERFL